MQADTALVLDLIYYVGFFELHFVNAIRCTYTYFSHANMEFVDLYIS